jgi:dTDP-3-amino-3,4,6-trideoxy-alpha-D-glucose transaminase
VLARDRSIRFLLPVHLYGHPLDLDELGRLRDEFDLRIVEDCAQAIGARHGETRVGTIGQASATSFYPTKNLGAMGDGGAVMTNNRDLAERARMLRNYGQSTVYSHDDTGLNSRLDELQAAIVRDALLPNLERWTDRRRQIAAQYRERLQNPLFHTLPVNDEAKSVWHIFPIFATSRDRLRTYLNELEIETAIHYPRVIPEQTALHHAQYDIADGPVRARDLAGSELSLPIHPFLTEEEIDRVIASLNSFPG